MALEFRKNRLSFLLSVIVIIMGFEIIYLVHQNRRLHKMVENPSQYFQTLKQDDIVPSFSAQDVDGNNISLRYGPTQPHTLLLWFSPTCSACEENLYFWNDLYRDYNSDQVRFLGMCPGDSAQARTMMADYDLRFPIVCLNDASLVEKYKGNVLPQTVFISPEGAIRGVWPGSLREEQQRIILSILTQLDSLSVKGGDIQ
jgi:peroxiredoxin